MKFVVSVLPTLLFLALFVVFWAFLFKVVCEILYASILAGIQMFPWARERWGKPGMTTLIVLWIFLPPIMLIVCLILGVVFGLMFILRSRITARQLDELYADALYAENRRFAQQPANQSNGTMHG